MKSFLDYMTEDADFNRKKEEEPKKEEGFFDNLDNGPKAVYGIDDYEKDSKKQMRYVYTFGAKQGPFPYEITCISGEFSKTSWTVTFTRGFDKLKSDDESKIKKCLKGLCNVLNGFVGGDVDFEESEDVSSITAYIKHNDNDMKKIVNDYLDTADLKVLKHDYNVDIDSRSSNTAIDAMLK
jgi:hypothetical protein